MVVAAANQNDDAGYYVPANVQKCITVGAIDYTNVRWISSTSQGSNYGSVIDLFAPGYYVQAALLNGDKTPFVGTSAAAPFVTGVVAQYLQDNIVNDQTDIETMVTWLKSNATTSSALAGSNPSGTTNKIVYTNPTLDWTP